MRFSQQSCENCENFAACCVVFVCFFLPGRAWTLDSRSLHLWWKFLSWDHHLGKIKNRNKSRMLHVWSGWFQICFIFNPTWGNSLQFDEHIFQMGWFNHQVDVLFLPTFRIKINWIYIYIFIWECFKCFKLPFFRTQKTRLFFWDGWISFWNDKIILGKL